VVYLSSLPEQEVKARLGRTSPYRYIQKPYDIAQLQAVLTAAMTETP
jgi:hypothetical protein